MPPLAPGPPTGGPLPRLLEIARQHGKSAAQVMLRWHPQEGRSAIPKSTKPARIAENLDVLDFGLCGEQVAAIDALDTGVRGGPEPDSITLEAYGVEIPEARDRPGAAGRPGTQGRDGSLGAPPSPIHPPSGKASF